MFSLIFNPHLLVEGQIVWYSRSRCLTCYHMSTAENSLDSRDFVENCFRAFSTNSGNLGFSGGCERSELSASGSEPSARRRRFK